MFERFSEEARRAVVLAQEEARLLDHDYIGTEHLLLGVLSERGSVAARVLAEVGVDVDDARAQVLEVVGRGQRTPSGHIPFTPRAKKVLELSLREALELEHDHIGSEHVLLGILREGEGVGAQVLDTFGADVEQVRRAVIEVTRAGPMRPQVEYRAGPPLVAASTVRRSWAHPAPPTPRCAMCGRDEERCAHVLIAGGMRVCSHCIRAAAAQLDALPPDAPRLLRYHRPEAVPPDKDSAVRAIEQAFEAVMGPMALPIDDAIEFAEGGDECRELLEAIRAVAGRVPVVVNDQTVERVRFVDEGEAEVSVGIWLAGNSQPMIQPGHAVLEDGTWKVARSALAHFAQQARPFLPPGT